MDLVIQQLEVLDLVHFVSGSYLSKSRVSLNCEFYLKYKVAQIWPGLIFLNHNCQTLACSNRLVVLTRAGGRVEVVSSLSQGRKTAAQCGLFTHKSVPIIFEPPCKSLNFIPSAHIQCPTRYRTRHFFNNSNTNEDIATKFEQEYVRCVRNVTTS
jgi:hypothetical protein